MHEVKRSLILSQIEKGVLHAATARVRAVAVVDDALAERGQGNGLGLSSSAGIMTPLITVKEKGPVLHDGTAQGSAKRIPDQGLPIYLRLRMGIEPVVGREPTRAVELERRAMRAVELNLTEQLFASRLGIRSILFRPPYSIDAEPDTEDQVRPLETTQDMGYITIGDKIDPNDWRDNPRHSADQIVADVLSHLPPCAPGDIRCGNIILLHDGGGNREQTVLALPRIIAGAREKGLQIVPLYQLLGRTRAEVMPPIPSNQRWIARLNLFGFVLFPLAFNAMTWIFFVGDVLMTGRLVFIGAFAIFDRLWPRRYGTPGDAAHYLPPVAVLIPAYNEEKVIVRTIRSALTSDYPNLRVIVIDDGSSDRTLEVARAAFALEAASGRVLILSKPNSGKADALNFGLEHLRGEEIFVGIDADTVIARDAVSRLIPHFLNPKVGAVAGNAKVGNRINLWTRWQALEYITSQNFERRALNTMGAVSVVPGAIGGWRVSAVREAGGFHTDTVAEDADLTMTLSPL